MKVPDCIILQLNEWNKSPKGQSKIYAIKSHKALIRYYKCKNKKRRDSHYKDYLRLNRKSFGVIR